jgi:hypothetical protein
MPLPLAAPPTTLPPQQQQPQLSRSVGPSQRVLLAASPLPIQGFVPFKAPKLSPDELDGSQAGIPVDTFDPIARAQQIVQQLPRRWRGNFRSFSGGGELPAALSIAAASAEGQMVVIRGEMEIGGVSSPIQANLNAKSDQLDLLMLGNRLGAGLEAGGEFQGLEGLSLSGWHASRLTDTGGRLELIPDRSVSSSGKGTPIRGLW